MKRAGNLIVDRHNLRLAFSKALCGKRCRPEARAFAERLEDNLRWMAQELRWGTFPVGRYRQFTIFDPKERLITAPCFAERVLHHALLNVCEPVFERFLIDDSFACRRGKGRIAALLRARHFARRQTFFLKLDIRKYFDSIPHAGLLARLERLFKDRGVFDLFGRIIGSYAKSAGYGLPIGSLTSQHFANFYLGFFDHFAKQSLRARGYVRYMDDCLLWGDSSLSLKSQLDQVRDFLREELELELKPEPYINRTEHGVDFLGCRVYRRHLVLNRRSRRRFCRKLRALQAAYEKA